VYIIISVDERLKILIAIIDAIENIKRTNEKQNNAFQFSQQKQVNTRLCALLSILTKGSKIVNTTSLLLLFLPRQCVPE